MVHLEKKWIMDLNFVNKAYKILVKVKTLNLNKCLRFMGLGVIKIGP